jgi:hypothetical protein
MNRSCSVAYGHRSPSGPGEPAVVRHVRRESALSRLSVRVQRWAGRHDDVRLLGLDRFRVQSRSGCYDLRVPFASPLGGPAGFSAAVADLFVCDPT